MSTTVAIARRLASAYPEAMLPCPTCAASLKAKNLDRHLADVHQLAPTLAPSGSMVELVGVDRRVFWWLLAPGLLWLSGAVVFLVLQATTGFAMSDLLAVPVVGLLLLSLLLPTLAALNLFRAKLVLDQGTLELRYACGLLTHRLTLPALLESGSLWAGRQAAGMSSYEHSVTEDVRVGSYLRLSNEQAAITVGCKGGSELRKHWDASRIRSGPRRRRWDITLDRVSSVELQYLLAAQHALTPAR